MKFCRGRGNNNLIQEKTEGCIRRFHDAGSFIGYLYRIVEYSVRALSFFCLFLDGLSYYELFISAIMLL